MKRVLLFSILIAYRIICYSQSIVVSSFKSLDADLTANTAGTMETDQNGETAALIKVVTTQTGFIFDGGALGIVKTKQTPGEVWVYIPKGSKKISIKHPQLGVLRDYYYPIAIEAARTYEMVLVAGEVQTIIKQARTSQFVVFQLEPSNAIVEIEGEQLGTYEGTATKLMKFGTYSYRINAPNYLPEAGSVTVNSPTEKHIVKIALKPNFSHVKLVADDNVEIWVNGIKKGVGTWNGDLGPGTYEFEAKKESYRSQSITQDITVSKDPLILNLPKPIPIIGEATINSNPAMAEVYIDDKRIGESPLVIPNLLIGKHSLLIRKSGFRDNNSFITIKENETTEYTAKLERDNKQEAVTTGNNGLVEIGIKNLSYTGKKTSDGGDYYGELKSGKPAGYGRAIYNNGNMYEGNYESGLRQGYGVYQFSDGERYEGEWYQDQQHGKGIYYFSNNSKYEGYWFRDYRQGNGVMYFFNGDKYDGEWYKDMRSGKGTYTFANGAYYKGEWKNDKKDGKGFFDWGDGSTYDGEWEDNQRSGNGTFTYSDGDIYTGQWLNDEINGHGIYKFKSGDIYEGDYSHGIRSGSGIFKYVNGDKYTGQFYNGERHGKGTFVWVNGDTYVGEWKNDKQDGKGKLIKKSGEIIDGVFKEGTLQNLIKQRKK